MKMPQINSFMDKAPRKIFAFLGCSQLFCITFDTKQPHLHNAQVTRSSLYRTRALGTTDSQVELNRHHFLVALKVKRFQESNVVLLWFWRVPNFETNSWRCRILLFPGDGFSNPITKNYLSLPFTALFQRTKYQNKIGPPQ